MQPSPSSNCLVLASQQSQSPAIERPPNPTKASFTVSGTFHSLSRLHPISMVSSLIEIDPRGDTVLILTRPNDPLSPDNKSYPW